MTSLHVVVGGQYGSEAKGHFCGALSQKLEGRQLHIRVAGPNAGHSVVSPLTGEKIALRQVPVAAVSTVDADLYIAPGSEVEMAVLLDEVSMLEAAGHPVQRRLWISPQATRLMPRHKDLEGGNDGPMQNRIGSTGKGVGAARADRIMRTAPLVQPVPPLEQLNVDVSDRPLQSIRAGVYDHVVIEGTQGYGLGLHAGHYPYCTSSDCRAIDFIAMSGVCLEDFNPVHTWVVYRTYPIRVAGNSGPMLEELDWATLTEQSGGYIQPERTTVTKKIRRVGGWDPVLAAAAWRANIVWPIPTSCHAVLMFADYLDPEIAGSTDPLEVAKAVGGWIDSTFGDDLRLPNYIGTGPDTGVWIMGLDQWVST